MFVSVCVLVVCAFGVFVCVCLCACVFILEFVSSRVRDVCRFVGSHLCVLAAFVV